MKILKRLIFIFIIIFLFNLFSSSITIFSDGFWCYSFSYSIAKGFIPYTDFNMIVPIFYPMLGAWFLKIFGTGYHIFILFHSLLMTFLFYILFKLYDKKAYFFLLVIFFSYFQLIWPTYNSCLLLFFFLIIYLEKNKKNDFLIGLIIGLAIITKLNIGLFFFLPSFYYIKNPKKILKRFLGILLPCFIFLIYLIVKQNFTEFLDLCILGLFSFQKDNTINKTGNTFLLFVLVYFLIKKIIKDKKNIYNYYALSSLTFAIPRIDTYHLYFCFFCSLIVFIENFKMQDIYATLIIIFTIISSVYLYFFYYNIPETKRISENSDFKYLFIRKKEYSTIKEIMKYHDEYPNSIVLGENSIGTLIDLYYNKRIRYLDVFNKGNYGFNGIRTIKKKLKDFDQKYFFIKKNSKIIDSQFYFEASKYIKENSEYIAEFSDYEIYFYKE